MKKPIVFLLLLILFLIGLKFFYPEIFYYDTFEVIRKFHDKWVRLYQVKPFKIISLFMAFNIVMAMLPVPGISMISFLGGSIFGFLPGILYSSIATAIGNLGGFLLGRFFLRDWVMEKYGHRVKVFEDDWQTNGAIALFSFRLFPLIPSFLANLVMGVSPLKWWTFFWVSWVGRIPMVLAYTYAGVEVANIEHISDVLHPGIFGVFALLAMLPWAFKYFYKKEKIT